MIVKEAVGQQRRLEGSDLVGDGETSGHAIASYMHLHYKVIVPYVHLHYNAIASYMHLHYNAITWKMLTT